MRRACITGGAGFIGSNVADRLISDGVEVVVIDNLSTGRREFIKHLLELPSFTFIEGDVLDGEALKAAFENCDWVFHLQANADVRHGLEHPMLDLEQNTIATSRVLEAMRLCDIRKIVFSSTGSIYGEPGVFPTPEDAPFPIQTSLYGASKLACEGLISAYATGFDFTAVICRFVSILGERYTHGHVWDFYRALKRDASVLRVLGDGNQQKSYLYVGDCIEAMMVAAAASEARSGVEIFNLGTDETIVVDESISLITEYLGLSPMIEKTGGQRGWIGDSPLIQLDTKRIRSLGWLPALTIRESVERTLRWFDENPYVLDSEHQRELGQLTKTQGREER